MRASRGIGSRIWQGGRVRYPCPAQSLAHAIALGIYGENRARDRISLLADVSTSERAPKDGILGWFVVPVREIAKCPRPGCFRVLLYVRGYVERVAFPGVLRTVRSGASRTQWSLATVYRYITTPWGGARRDPMVGPWHIGHTREPRECGVASRGGPPPRRSADVFTSPPQSSLDCEYNHIPSSLLPCEQRPAFRLAAYRVHRAVLKACGTRAGSAQGAKPRTNVRFGTHIRSVTLRPTTSTTRARGSAPRSRACLSSPYPPAWVEEWLPILVRAPHLSPLLLLLLPVPVPAALANCAAQARALAPSTASVSLVAAHRAVRSR